MTFIDLVAPKSSMTAMSNSTIRPTGIFSVYLHVLCPAETHIQLTHATRILSFCYDKHRQEVASSYPTPYKLLYIWRKCQKQNTREDIQVKPILIMKSGCYFTAKKNINLNRPFSSFTMLHLHILPLTSLVYLPIQGTKLFQFFLLFFNPLIRTCVFKA